MMSLAAALLGLLMFIWGFLKWFHLEDSGDKQRYAGYAFGMPTTAAIGFSIAAGMLALFGAMERRPGRGVDSAVPLAMSATSLLLIIGLLIGKGSISPHNSFAHVGVEVGLILGLITAILQTLVLGAAWASRSSDAADTRGSGVYGGGTGGPVGTGTAGSVYGSPTEPHFEAPTQAQTPPLDVAAPPQTYGETAPPPPGYAPPPAGGTTYPPAGGTTYPPAGGTTYPPGGPA
jgi:hypothetical protein